VLTKYLLKAATWAVVFTAAIAAVFALALIVPGAPAGGKSLHFEG
jgi:hypothetical protein